MSYTVNQVLNEILDWNLSDTIYNAIVDTDNSNLEISDTESREIRIDHITNQQVLCEINFILGENFYREWPGYEWNSEPFVGKYGFTSLMEDLTTENMIQSLCVRAAYAKNIHKPGFKRYWLSINTGKTGNDFAERIENDYYNMLITEIDSIAGTLIKDYNKGNKDLSLLHKYKDQILITDKVQEVLDLN